RASSGGGAERGHGFALQLALAARAHTEELRNCLLAEVVAQANPGPEQEDGRVLHPDRAEAHLESTDELEQVRRGEVAVMPEEVGGGARGQLVTGAVESGLAISGRQSNEAPRRCRAVRPIAG